MYCSNSMYIFIPQDLFIIGLLMFSTASCNLWFGHGHSTFDVFQYGAKGDGVSDDTQAFVKAWKDLCGANSGTTATLVVPAGHTFLVHQIRFKGPCQSKNVNIKIMGNIIAPPRNAWGACSKRWLYFLGVNGLTLDGTGVINGHGQSWWGSLNGTEGCTGLPTALLFERCDGLQISRLTHINGPASHIFVVHSQDVTISGVHINSPKGISHNTDGIDISNTVRVNIRNSIIGSGDDCIAIKGGSRFINISHVTCGPGHGISVGSLGENGEEEFAEHVNVRNCTFNGADSAARIKTWPGGKGYAKAIIYENIIVNQTNYPVYIDQHYMRTPEKKEALKVTDVTFRNIHGTCTNKHAVVLDCAKIGCDNIKLQQINITSIDLDKPASAICHNVHGTATDVISPRVTCLHH